MVLCREARAGAALTLAFLACVAAVAPAAAQGTAPRPGGPVVPFEDPRVPPDAEVAFSEANVTGDNRIDALLSGYQWPGLTITYSFYSSAVFAGTYYGGETGVREVSAGVKQNVRAIMAWYAAATNLNLVEVTETASTIGQIRILLSSGPAFAYTYYPSSTAMFHLAGDVHLNPGYDRLGDTNGFQHPPGEHGYVTLIHELGHALGLKHPHTGVPTLPTGQDNHTHTVMSYQFPGRSPGTLMIYDLLALQYLYGARPARTGNDTYTFTRAALDQFTVGGQLSLDPSNATKQALWDAGGTNTLDLSTLPGNASGYRLDLKPLGWLSSWADYWTTYLTAGTEIGPDVAVHTVINSSSNDTIYANASANVFGGYTPTRTTGQDQIVGATRGDVIDLSAFSPSNVQETPAGNDLVINLGSPGTITLKDYYLTDPPTISYGSGTVPTVSIADASVAEGQAGTTPATFRVTLSAPAVATLTVNYATADRTAGAGWDYVATSGTLVFAPGETSKSFVVPVIGDVVAEPDDTFVVRLTSPSAGLDILDNEATGTILNDDLVTVSIADSSVAEGNAGTTPATFQLTLSAPAATTLTVNYATADSSATVGWDYVATSGTVIFAPGETSKAIVVSVVGDTGVEPDDAFFVWLTSPSTGLEILDNRATGTILNDDVASGTGGGTGAGGGSGDGLRAEYFDNANFTAPALTRVDATVDFDWGYGAPTATMGADLFSVRWTGQIEVPATDTYTFSTTSDDGVRLWVNGQLIIDNWTDHAPTENSGAITLSAGQRYDIRLEFYENGGGAVARLLWSSVSIPRAVVPKARLYSGRTTTTSALGDGLRAEYFDNANFTAPALTRVDATVDFDWGYGAPTATMGADLFSVRWTGQIEVPATDTYTFTTTSDDGVRLWVNGQLIIDNWTDHAPTENSGAISLSTGQRYDIRLEFYENGGGAVARLLWSSPAIPRTVVPKAQLYSSRTATTSVVGDGLRAEYFDNADFTAPALTRVDATVDFDWGYGAPTVTMGADLFSVRWTGQIEVPATDTYTFSTTSDDGVRLWVNGQLLIDNWTDHAPTENSGAITLSAGQRYDIRLEFYENGGGAVARLFWSSASIPKSPINRAHLYSTP